MYKFLRYASDSFWGRERADVWWCEVLMLVTVLPVIACIIGAFMRKLRIT